MNINKNKKGGVEKVFPLLFAPKSPKGDLLMYRLLQTPL
jgi:hypothetical protein